jgi:putative transposase
LGSSHRHHVGLKIDPLVSDHSLFWSIGNTPFDRQTAYKALFDQTSDPVELEGIRAAIRQSQALASTGFAAAAKIGQEHLPRTRPVGRPRKAQ